MPSKSNHLLGIIQQGWVVERALRVILDQRRTLPGEAAIGGGRQAQRGALQLGVIVGSHKRVVGQRYRVQLQVGRCSLRSLVTGDCRRKEHISCNPEAHNVLARRNGECFSCKITIGPPPAWCCIALLHLASATQGHRQILSKQHLQSFTAHATVTQPMMSFIGLRVKPKALARLDAACTSA